MAKYKLNPEQYEKLVESFVKKERIDEVFGEIAGLAWDLGSATAKFAWKKLKLDKTKLGKGLQKIEDILAGRTQDEILNREELNTVTASVKYTKNTLEGIEKDALKLLSETKKQFKNQVNQITKNYGNSSNIDFKFKPLFTSGQNNDVVTVYAKNNYNNNVKLGTITLEYITPPQSTNNNNNIIQYRYIFNSGVKSAIKVNGKPDYRYVFSKNISNLNYNTVDDNKNVVKYTFNISNNKLYINVEAKEIYSYKNPLTWVLTSNLFYNQTAMWYYNIPKLDKIFNKLVDDVYIKFLKTLYEYANNTTPLPIVSDIIKEIIQNKGNPIESLVTEGIDGKKQLEKTIKDNIKDIDKKIKITEENIKADMLILKRVMSEAIKKIKNRINREKWEIEDREMKRGRYYTNMETARRRNTQKK